jgi:hypothetical protein
MKLLLMQFSPPSRHSIPLWSKYSPQHPVLKHTQFTEHKMDNSVLLVDSSDVSERVSKNKKQGDLEDGNDIALKRQSPSELQGTRYSPQPQRRGTRNQQSERLPQSLVTLAGRPSTPN